MTRPPENLRNIFDFNSVVPIIEKHIGPVETLIVSGSAISNDSRFDRDGLNTSDIDLIVIISRNFKKKKIPNWESAPPIDNELETKGVVAGRTIHIRAFSNSHVIEILDRLVGQIDGPSRNLHMPFFVLGKEKADGQIVRGSLPTHRFFTNYENPPTGSHMELLKDAIPFYF